MLNKTFRTYGVRLDVQIVWSNLPFIVRINLPFKDQVSANAVRRQLKEAKPSIVNQQCVIYHFVCDLCDADIVGYTARHLFQRVAKNKNSVIGMHFYEVHGRSNLLNEKGWGGGKFLKKLWCCVGGSTTR